MGENKELLRERFVNFDSGESGTLVNVHRAAEDGYLYVEYYPELTVWSFWKIIFPFAHKPKYTKAYPKDQIMQHRYESDTKRDINPVWTVIMPDDCPFVTDTIKKLRNQLKDKEEQLNLEQAGKSGAAKRLREMETSTKKSEAGEKGRSRPSPFFGKGSDSFPHDEY